jgi:hypothetical protein
LEGRTFSDMVVAKSGRGFGCQKSPINDYF